MSLYVIKRGIFFLIFLVCTNMGSYGQISKPRIIVLNGDPPIVYLGVDNYLSFSGKISCDSILWYVDNGTITKIDSTCTAILRPLAIGQCIISFKGRKSGKHIASDTIQVNNLPDPQIWLAGKPGGKILKKHLNVQLGLKAYFESPPIQNSYAIKSFAVLLIRNGSVEMFYNYGPTFGAQVKSILQKANIGDKLIIADITVLNSSNEEIKLSPAEFDIVK